MKIINPKKFIRGIGLIIFLAIITVLILSSENISLSHKEIQYKEIYVANGDTLWSIALNERNENSYYYNKDVREIIKNIKDTNKLNSSVLYIGQKLTIPI